MGLGHDHLLCHQLLYGSRIIHRYTELYPSAFASLRGWGEGFVNLCNAMAGLGGWIGVAAAIIFSIMAAKKGSRFMAVFGNVICGILCIIFATTKNMGVFLVIVVCLTFVSGNIQLNVVPNNIMNIWFPHKKGLALGWASMGLPICTATIILILNAIGNPQTAYIIIGIACFVVAVLSIFWAKDTPEEVGATPDNEPIEHEQAMLQKEKQEAAAAKMTMGVTAKDKNTGSRIRTWFLMDDNHRSCIQLCHKINYGRNCSYTRCYNAYRCCYCGYCRKLHLGLVRSEVWNEKCFPDLRCMVSHRIITDDFPESAP